MATSRDTIPLPLALHLATYTVIGLFCMLAGPLNLLDPIKIIPNGVLFLAIGGFSWGYVFGIFMGRREAVILGYLASGLWMGAAGWVLGQGDERLAALCAAISVTGILALMRYSRWVMAA